MCTSPKCTAQRALTESRYTCHECLDAETQTQGVPGGLVVRIPGFHCPGSIPGQGAEILQASRCDKKQIQKPTDLMTTF